MTPSGKVLISKNNLATLFLFLKCRKNSFGNIQFLGPTYSFHRMMIKMATANIPTVGPTFQNLRHESNPERNLENLYVL